MLATTECCVQGMIYSPIIYWLADSLLASLFIGRVLVMHEHEVPSLILITPAIVLLHII